MGNCATSIHGFDRQTQWWPTQTNHRYSDQSDLFDREVSYLRKKKKAGAHSSRSNSSSRNAAHNGGKFGIFWATFSLPLAFLFFFSKWNLCGWRQKLTTDAKCFTMLRRKCMTFSLPESRSLKWKLERPTCRLRCPVVGLDTIAGTEAEKKKTAGKGSFPNSTRQGFALCHWQPLTTLTTSSTPKRIVEYNWNRHNLHHIWSNISIIFQNNLSPGLISPCGNTP